MFFWTALNIFEKIVLVLAVAAYILILIKVISDSVQFYKIDKLSAEADKLSNYDEIVNNDFDGEKRAPRFFTLTSLYVFIASFGTAYFLFKPLLKNAWLIVASLFSACVIFVVFSIFKRVFFSEQPTK